MNYKTQSQKTPHETLKFQEKSLLLLQTNDVQVMLLQTQRVSEMSFSAIWKPKLQKLSLWCPTMGASYRELFKQTVKKLNLWWKTAVDKSGWIRAWIGSVILSLDIFLYIFFTQIWSNKHFILVLDSIKQKTIVTKQYNIYPQKGFQKPYEGCFGRPNFQIFLCRQNMKGDII